MKEYLVKVQSQEDAILSKVNDNKATEYTTKAESKDDKYPSSKLLLSILQKENDYDMQNIASLYTRTGIIIAFTGLFLNLIYSNFNDVLAKYTGVDKVPTKLGVYKILIIGTIVMCIFSIIMFIWVIFAKKFERLIIGDVFKKSTMQEPEEYIASELVKAYKKVINKNKDIINLKNIIYIWGLVLLVIAIILFISSIIITNFMF